MTHLPFLSSDHAPLYLQLSQEVAGNPRHRPFRFEAAWLTHASFKDLLLTSWDGSLSTPKALECLRKTLRKWNKEVFGDVKKRKEKLVDEIKEVQDLLDLSQTDELLGKEEALIKEFDKVLEQEELLWFQKSREKWVTQGDRNTSFFHTSTIIRRRRNRIEMLKNDEGSWVSNPQELEKLATDYYKRLYSLDDIEQEVESLSNEGFTRITQGEQTELSKPFVGMEVDKAVRGMGKYKAPVQMGFSRCFINTAGKLLENQCFGSP